MISMKIRCALTLVLTFSFVGPAPLVGDDDVVRIRATGSVTPDTPLLRPGDTAPELQVSGWTDAQTRRLADYCGRVVVIEFWGTWCGPCIRMIPAIKKLQMKYEDDNVVFLGIHSAGHSDADVKLQLSRNDWQIPTAMDKGSSLADSATAQAYGVAGYPTIVIVDRNGKVTYHSGRVTRQAFMERTERLASQLELPWPIDEDCDDLDDLAARLNQLAVALYGEQIERALK